MSDMENLSFDASEYQLVFKMFDKEHTGEISIKGVYSLLEDFDR
jgi:Ca2+-binding EF-hand superfamily protein